MQKNYVVIEMVVFQKKAKIGIVKKLIRAKISHGHTQSFNLKVNSQ